MIYRTTKQFFPSSYIKKRRKFQKDQRVIRDRIWRFYAHYSYPKRIVSETRPTATSLDNINPTPPPFSRKISQRKSSKSKLTKCGFQCDYVECYVFEVGHVTRGYTRSVQVALLRAVAVFGLLRHLSARGGPKGAARRIDEWLIGGNASTTNRHRSAPPLDPLPPVCRKFGTSCVWIVEDDASVGKLNRFFRLSRDITDTTGATLAP